MPAFDGTGPAGMGPMTGRGFGPCALPAGRQGMGIVWRRGMGQGFGRGRGYGRGLGRYFGWNWLQTKTDRKNALSDYKKALEEELEDVNKELEDLSKTG
jgi:hypothetical protein